MSCSVEAPPILEQLYLIHVEQEHWITNKLTKEQFFLYTDKLIRQGNIFFILDGDRVVGYTEVWKISFSQFGRIICGEKFCADGEDVISGNLGYVANVWTDQEYRQGFGTMKGVVKEMRKMYYAFTADVEYHVGMALRKNAHLVKTFKASSLKGEKYGR